MDSEYKSMVSLNYLCSGDIQKESILSDFVMYPGVCFQIVAACRIPSALLVASFEAQWDFYKHRRGRVRGKQLTNTQ